MIVTKKFSVRIADLYFDEQPSDLNADVARYVQWSQPVPEARWVPFCTRVIDLRKDASALMSDMSGKTRYEIRRAGGDGLVHCPAAEATPEILSQFCEFYDRFAELKGLSQISRERIKILAACGALHLTHVADQQGKILAWHAYWRVACRVRLWLSATLHRAAADASERALIGRANRYHIWHDMLTFQEAGFRIFDLGGWYAGTDDHEKLGINWFKKGFGGEVVQNFNGMKALSLKGRMAVWMYDKLRHGIA